MKKFLLSILSSKSGVSSKRVITLLAFILMAIGFISNLFFTFKIDEHVYKSMEWIVEIGMGTIVAEKFSRKKQSDDETLE
jgi:hypothetical protein